MWIEFCGELLGTFMLIVLGNGVVANVVLEKTKGSNDWSYSWIPVLGPILGAGLAAIIYNILPF